MLHCILRKKGKLTRMIPFIFTHVFSVTCIAPIFQHPSFDIVFRHAEQTRKYTNHRPVFVSCHFFGSESQVQKVTPVGCDWSILILVCLACQKRMSGDVFRTTAAMHKTLKVGVISICVYYFVCHVSKD